MSAWLRDYLYIALGGNRKGEARTYFNLMITMLLGGLWHGASWTFVVWGGLHGIYLCVEKVIRDKTQPKLIPVIPEERVVVQSSFVPAFLNRKGAQQFLLAMFTFFLVNVTWVFFRSDDFTTAMKLLNSMFGSVSNATPLLQTIDIYKVLIVILFIVIFHWFMRDTKVLAVAAKLRWWVLTLVWTILLVGIILAQESTSSFIYFQF